MGIGAGVTVTLVLGNIHAKYGVIRQYLVKLYKQNISKEKGMQMFTGKIIAVICCSHETQSLTNVSLCVPNVLKPAYEL